MFTPDEVVATRVLPTLRFMVADRLADRGLTERVIAGRMGLTQSAVSKYLRGRTRKERRVLESPRFQELAERLAGRLAECSMSVPEALGETLALVRNEEDRGLVCTLHEEQVPELRGLGCDLCVRAGSSSLLLEQEALGDLRTALRLIEGDPAFARLIPSVGSNLARARHGASTPLEVAAVPGRIFEMRGAARVPAAPEFGASKHVAEVVLAASGVFPELTAAFNVRADGPTLKAAASLGWALVEFEAAYEGRGDRIAKSLRGRKRPPRGLYHTGAFGIEPILYILARSAREAVEQAKALAAALPPSG